MRARLVLLLAFLIGPAIATAQNDDAGAERARLANERIQAEMERRQREDQERAEASARAEEARQQRARQADQVSQVPPPDRPPVPPAATEPVDLSEVLEQLRTLGELRDAGYVTDDEFARIKEKILDKQL